MISKSEIATFNWVCGTHCITDVVTACTTKGRIALQMWWQYVQQKGALHYRCGDSMYNKRLNGFVNYLAETVDIWSNISRWGLRPSAILRRVDWSFVADFSKQHYSLTFKWSNSFRIIFWLVERWRWDWQFVPKGCIIKTPRYVTSQESADLIRTALKA
jgi:hypothetical protein